MKVELLPVVEADYDAFFAMFEPYMDELAAYPSESDPTTIEQYRAATLADMYGRELIWIIADGERAGLAVVRTSADWPDDRRQIASIAEFYVMPATRRHGVGRAAVEALLAEHRRRGTHLVEADILHGNKPAMAFWASLGFEVQAIQTARRP